MRLSPVAETTGGQILSIVAIRPWELAVRESRKGDIATVHDKWPGDVTFMFQLVRYAKALPALDGVHEALSPLRLLQFDDSRFAVDMTAYVPNTLLVGLTAYHSNPSDFHHPSVTVAALPWSPDRSEADRQGALALWSSSLRNPLVAHARPEDVLSGEEIASRIGSGAFRIESVDAMTDRLFGARRSDRGST